MEMIECACGCGMPRPRYDKKGRERLYIHGHQNRRKTADQIAAWKRNMSKRPLEVWNKGKTYTFSSKQVYANKGAWNKAIRRLFPDACMRCGWNEASCDTHHIIPKSRGGQYIIENGIVLCPNCHRLADFGLLVTSELQAARSRAVMTGEIV